MYRTEMLKTGFSLGRIQILEVSQYLERFLWPNYPTMDGMGGDEGGEVAPPAPEHTLSLVAIINEKYRERVPSWKVGGGTDMWCVFTCSWKGLCRKEIYVNITMIFVISHYTCISLLNLLISY